MCSVHTKADFMRKILAEPDDDTSRLVYADFLEEHCDEPLRAKLIRVQCRLDEIERSIQKQVAKYNLDHKKAGTGVIIAGTIISDEKTELQKQEKELLNHGRVFDWIHFTQCLSGMPAVKYLGGGVCQFYYDKSTKSDLYTTWRRGFVESLTCTAEDWIRHSGGIWPSEEEPYYETAHPLKMVCFRRWMGLNELNYRLMGDGKTVIVRNKLLTRWYEIEPTIPRLEGTTRTSDLVNILFSSVYPGLQFELVS